MGAMRAAVAALGVSLALVAVGCAGAGAGTAPNGSLGRDAAKLVPPDALAFVSVNTKVDSDQWKTVESLTGGLAMLRAELRKHQLDFDRDVRPALGDEVDLAVLGVRNGKPEVIALARPTDEAKLRALAAKFDSGSEHYTVERIGDWSVVADSKESFDAVRRAESGRSLADTANFQAAEGQAGGDALVTAYADSTALQQLPGRLGALVRAGGSPRWVAVRAAADGNAVRLELQAGSQQSAPAVYRPSLLGEVPSGALLAVSFKDVQLGLKRLASLRGLKGLGGSLGLPLAGLAPALRGEGVFYVVQGTILPTFVLEVDSPNPQAAAQALRGVAARIAARTGNALALNVTTHDNRVILTNGAAVPTTGARLVDDQPYKDALAAAGAPAEVTFLAYADVQRLAPIVQALSQLLSRGKPNLLGTTAKLDRFGTLVAFGARSGSTSRLEVRLTLR
jgi:hypothetical protein